MINRPQEVTTFNPNLLTENPDDLFNIGVQSKSIKYKSKRKKKRIPISSNKRKPLEFKRKKLTIEEVLDPEIDIEMQDTIPQISNNQNLPITNLGNTTNINPTIRYKRSLPIQFENNKNLVVNVPQSDIPMIEDISSNKKIQYIKKPTLTYIGKPPLQLQYQQSNITSPHKSNQLVPYNDPAIKKPSPNNNQIAIIDPSQNIQSFTCPICQTSLSTKWSLNRHLISVHREMPIIASKKGKDIVRGSIINQKRNKNLKKIKKKSVKNAMTSDNFQSWIKEPDTKKAEFDKKKLSKLQNNADFGKRSTEDAKLPTKTLDKKTKTERFPFESWEID